LTSSQQQQQQKNSFTQKKNKVKMNKLMNLMDNFSQFTENVYKSVHNNGSERAERHQFEETEIKWTKGCGDIFRSHF
jgi:hypothetical protein